MRVNTRRRSAVALPLALLLVVAGLIGVRAAVSKAAAGDINTVAGTGSGSSSGDNGAATSAGVVPLALTSDDYGNYYIGERGRIRRVEAATGVIKTILGNGTYASGGDGGPAGSAFMQSPFDLGLDSGGNLYFMEGTDAAAGSNPTGKSIRKINADTGVVTRLLDLDDNLRGGPTAMAVDRSGNVYVGWASYVFEYTAASNYTNFLIKAGQGFEGDSGDGGSATGNNVRFGTIGAIAVDSGGNVFFGDTTNSKIRKVETGGIIRTAVGGASHFDNTYPKAVTQVNVSGPEGLTFDRAGSLFIVEAKKLRITRVTGTTISLVAGSGSDSTTFIGDGGPAVDAKFAAPNSVTTTPNGNVLIGDGGSSDFGSGQNRVRRVEGAAGVVTAGPMIGYGGDRSAPTANFGFSTTTPNVGQAVTLTDTSTNGPLTAWSWNFGDTTTSTQQNPAKTWTAAGTFSVALTVTKWNGATASVTKQVTVSQVVSNPVADFTFAPASGVINAVVFTDTSTNGPFSSWAWNFGDSTTSTQQNPSKTWTTAGTYSVALTVNKTGGGTASVTKQVTVNDTTPPPSNAYKPMTPKRVLETRPEAPGGIQGVATGGKIGQTAIELDVTTPLIAAFPGTIAANVDAVVINVTVTGPTAQSWVTVWPTGSAMPGSSNLNMSPNQTIPNLVVAKVGAGGKISLANANGQTHMIADLMGWFPKNSGYVPLPPARVLETRAAPLGPIGVATAGKMGATPVTLSLNGKGGLPAGGGIGAVVLNVTSTGSTASSWATIWPGNEAMPDASNLNYQDGETIPNLVVAKVAPDGTIKLNNAVGQTNLVADVMGYFPTGADVLQPLTPKRMLDTRTGIGAAQQPVAAGSPITLDPRGVGAVPAGATSGAVVLNVTSIGASTTTWVTVWPSRIAQPDASNLNSVAADVIPNLVIVKLGSDGKIQLANAIGSTNLVADVVGYLPATTGA